MKCQTVKPLSLSISEYLKIEIKEEILFICFLLTLQWAAVMVMISSSDSCVCWSTVMCRKLWRSPAGALSGSRTEHSRISFHPLYFFKIGLPKVPQASLWLITLASCWSPSSWPPCLSPLNSNPVLLISLCVLQFSSGIPCTLSLIPFFHSAVFLSILFPLQIEMWSLCHAKWCQYWMLTCLPPLSSYVYPSVQA